MSTIIIAEAGVNHNGDVLIAKELINVAKDSGADYVKFQIFKSELLSTAEAKKAEYQKKDDKNESQKEMLENLEFDFNVFKDLKNYADEIGIGFLASAFDNESLEFLIDLKLDFIKIPIFIVLPLGPAPTYFCYPHLWRADLNFWMPTSIRADRARGWSTLCAREFIQ